MADYNNTRDSSLPDPASPGFRDGDTITLQNGSKFSRQAGRWEPVRFQTVGQQSKEMPLFASFSDEGVVFDAATTAAIATIASNSVPSWTAYLNNDLTSLNNAYSTTTRGAIYDAFKDLKLWGFDSTKPLKLKYVWNDSYNPTNHYFRISFEYWTGSAWAAAFDSGNLQMYDQGLVNNAVGQYRGTVSGKTVHATIDFSKLPVNGSFTINAGVPEYVCSESCFRTDTVDQYYATLISAQSDEQKKVGAARRIVQRRKATFAIVFDDKAKSDELVYSLCQEYGFLPSFALNTTNFTAEQAFRYINLWKKGCTMLSHSVTHPVMNNSGTITAPAVEAEMANSKKTIESFGIPISGWVTPSTDLHADFTALVKKYYGYAFTGQNAGKFDATVNPWQMTRYGMEANAAGGNIAVVLARIQTAIANNELLVLYGHQMPSAYLNGDNSSYFSVDYFRQVLAALRSAEDAGSSITLPCDEAVRLYYAADLA